MTSSYAPRNRYVRRLRETLWAFSRINRLPETTGYNVAYVVLALGIARAKSAFGIAPSEAVLVGVAFGAVMLTKMQASVADALHDYDIDRDNPEKASTSLAVDTVGREVGHSLLGIELVLGLALWAVLSLQTMSALFLVCGLALAVAGFTYSYPPRLKERGILNHVTTTGADVGCVVLPLVVLLGAPEAAYLGLALSVVFLYTFGYHVVHQAADTYYDRRSGIETFTQDVGVGASLLLAAGTTLLAGCGAILLGANVAAACGFLVSVAYVVQYLRTRGCDEKRQTDVVARYFHVGTYATFLNGTFALSLLV